MRKIIVIVGPTSAGKTAVSVELARAIGGEIVSADSRQVYRGLNIGTGKVTPEEMQGVPHHLLDVADPKEAFSAGEYAKEARTAVDTITERGHVPVVVGGTGFYIDALSGGVSLPDVPPNPGLRKELAEKSLEELRTELFGLDPERAKTVDTKNRVRLVRAIEIARALGSVPRPSPERLYDLCWLGVALPRAELEKKIHTRLLARLAAGMLKEAERLHEEGLSYERMEELGLEYRYMARHLKGTLSYDGMVSQLETEIRKYAKRQMTWFKRNKAITWFSPGEKTEMLRAVQGFLER